MRDLKASDMLTITNCQRPYGSRFENIRASSKLMHDATIHYSTDNAYMLTCFNCINKASALDTVQVKLLVLHRNEHQKHNMTTAQDCSKELPLI